jgi:hypothetical protein
MTEQEKIDLLNSKMNKLDKASKYYIDALTAKLAEIHTTEPSYKKTEALEDPGGEKNNR